jgi:hypothetical protein
MLTEDWLPSAQISGKCWSPSSPPQGRDAESRFAAAGREVTAAARPAGSLPGRLDQGLDFPLAKS